MVTNLQLYLLAGVPTATVICAHLIFTVFLRRALRQMNARFDSLERSMDSMFDTSASS